MHTINMQRMKIENGEYILFILVEKEGESERKMYIFYLAEINSQIFDKTALR